VRVFEDLTYDYLRPPHLAINMLLIDDRGYRA
jgi:hypothetical protein